MDEQKNVFLQLTKALTIVVLLGVNTLVGSLPLRNTNFKTNRILLAFASAFAGGMFLAIGLIQVLPRAVSYFPHGIKDFPKAQIITLVTFMLLIALEKIILGQGEQLQPRKILLNHEQIDYQNPTASLISQTLGDNEQIFKETISTQVKVAHKMSTIYQEQREQVLLENQQRESSNLKYYIIQTGFGLYSLFEGFAIGLEDQISNVLIVFVALLFQKWSESLALGFAFRQANIPIGICVRILIVQGLMTPIGIGLGWIFNGEMDGVIYAMAAGAFLYQATMEIIVEEFNIARFKMLKYGIFLISIGLVSAFWPVEQKEYI